MYFFTWENDSLSQDGETGKMMPEPKTQEEISSRSPPMNGHPALLITRMLLSRPLPPTHHAVFLD
jgi:hypothetical protein